MERSEVGVCCEELYCGHVCRLRSPDGGGGGVGREVGSVEGGKYITDIDMELRMLLKHMKDSLVAVSCDLKTGKKMASLSVRTAWPLSGCPELRSISAAPAGITARSHRPP